MCAGPARSGRRFPSGRRSFAFLWGMDLGKAVDKASFCGVLQPYEFPTAHTRACAGRVIVFSGEVVERVREVQCQFGGEGMMVPAASFPDRTVGVHDNLHMVSLRISGNRFVAQADYVRDVGTREQTLVDPAHAGIIGDQD